MTDFFVPFMISGVINVLLVIWVAAHATANSELRQELRTVAGLAKLYGNRCRELEQEAKELNEARQ